MLESAGSLLRAWRMQAGRTQAEVAEVLNVTKGAVSSWETGSRSIPQDRLERLDLEYGTGGCLTDLVRCVGGPGLLEQDPGVAGLVPRRYWPHVFTADTGQIWIWIRSGDGRPLGGYVYSGSNGVRIEPPAAGTAEDAAQDAGGLFLTVPGWHHTWPLQVVLDEPGWVDFGRGTPPPWLGPVRVRALPTDLEMLGVDADQVEWFVDRLRRLDGGDPDTLLDRMVSLLGEDLMKRWEASWRDRTPFPQLAETSGALGDSRSFAAAAQRQAHRLLREVRGLSRAGAAAGVVQVLRGGVTGVSEDQIKRYESGQTSRIRHLPAVLDRVYEGGGWTCFEPVGVRRSPGRYDVDLPGFWLGPVTIRVEPPTTSPPTPGSVVLETGWFHTEQPLPAGAQSFTFCRTIQDDSLSVQVPAGWAVRAWMGHDPAARDANRHWVPTERHADDIVVQYLRAWMRLVGRSEDDLARALRRPSLLAGE